MKIGIFALQGAFLEHRIALEKLGAETVEIRRRTHFSDGLDGIVLPGGESTVQGKLLREEGLFDPVRAAIAGGVPVFGTCAGLILLADRLSNDRFFSDGPHGKGDRKLSGGIYSRAVYRRGRAGRGSACGSRGKSGCRAERQSTRNRVSSGTDGRSSDARLFSRHCARRINAVN